MLSLINWQKNACQICLEGTSFYYVRKMPVAFRQPADPKRLIVRDEKFGQEAQSFVEILQSLRCRIDPVKPGDFQKLVRKAYDSALFDGVKRITQQRLHVDIGDEPENYDDGSWQPDYDK